MLTLEKLHKELSKVCSTAYSHFDDGPVQTPFICYFEDESNNFCADNRIYGTKTSMVIELYTEKKDLKIEAEIEKIFRENQLLWYSVSQYIKDENLFMKAYYVEFMEGKYYE